MTSIVDGSSSVLWTNVDVTMATDMLLVEICVRKSNMANIVNKIPIVSVLRIPIAILLMKPAFVFMVFIPFLSHFKAKSKQFVTKLNTSMVCFIPPELNFQFA